MRQLKLMLRFGRFALHAIDLGSFWLDGGTVYGSIPKTTWATITPADDANRVELALRSLLLVEELVPGRAQRRILIDTGLGNTLSDACRLQMRYQPPPGGLAGALGAVGVAPDQITDVILTHLHTDHAGGAVTTSADGRIVPSLPSATYHVQRRALKWSGHPTEKDAPWFEDYVCDVLARAGSLHLIDGPAELFEDVSVSLSEGHTVGQQLPLIEGTDSKLLFCGDVIPTLAHLRATWISADDLYPLITLEEKKLILAEALDESWLLFFCHDPHVAICGLTERQGEVMGGPPVDPTP